MVSQLLKCFQHLTTRFPEHDLDVLDGIEFIEILLAK